eukprot:CAMPEP_0181440872 /NCGR_PEP_ID=MMETSP1110-20121109/23204_1 /TAXON_ID=174948 /ORGANISM="Symbiodinium sp., Strain CCMP421" /LENGTH=76 /DNA_ID=CAMNT_0023564715 /DNA_START=36 /DNA_END=263 /DNA_ORIENTATION=-
MTARFLVLLAGAWGHQHGGHHDHCMEKNTSMVPYACNTTTCDGYIAYGHETCTSSMKCPAVVIIQDWNGMNDYEKE